ncbi:MAG TPA: endonuclease/exonuclease/phosphatase family protein [Planctomycetota bacterium]|nr:endonuclease/exonuclease/phosphatase family protein [Planctomycetota bacterium]
MPFTVVSYNVLADSYIRREYYPFTAAALLEPAWRRAALVRHVVALDADVICLQEVERPVLDLLAAALTGHQHHYGQKTGGKPDGCATLWRRASFTCRQASTLAYTDGTGHVASIVELEREGRVLGIANTHARWDAPGTPPAEQRGLREVTELVERLRATPASWIVCGDLNAEPESDLVRFLVGAGFRDPFPVTAFTCNANRKRKKIDYLFHTADLVATPGSVPRVEDGTPLPSEDQPSDHVAIQATFDWK